MADTDGTICKVLVDRVWRLHLAVAACFITISSLPIISMHHFHIKIFAYHIHNKISTKSSICRLPLDKQKQLVLMLSDDMVSMMDVMFMWEYDIVVVECEKQIEVTIKSFGAT